MAKISGNDAESDSSSGFICESALHDPPAAPCEAAGKARAPANKADKGMKNFMFFCF